MTTLTAPVRIEVPARTAVRPAAPLHPPRNAEQPVTTDRRSQRFTVRAGTSSTDDFGGSRWDIRPDGLVSQSAL